jgi:hypothetical protein
MHENIIISKDTLHAYIKVHCGRHVCMCSKVHIYRENMMHIYYIHQKEKSLPDYQFVRNNGTCTFVHKKRQMQDHYGVTTTITR